MTFGETGTGINEDLVCKNEKDDAPNKVQEEFLHAPVLNVVNCDAKKVHFVAA